MHKHLTAQMTALVLGLGVVSVAPMAARAQISVGISVGFAPPPLPIYEQPPIPGYGYFWTPGYWAWDGFINDYYWVPGTWVRPPRIGFLWTPAYWGWSNGRYVFNNGYWGPHIGFYGGINYGYGYNGEGYDGGYWRGDRLYYNRSVNNISNVRITTVYNKIVIRNATVNRISYAGGVGGTQARPSTEQLAVVRETHIGPTPTQLQHRDMAAKDRNLRASVNHGAPPVAATPLPARFDGAGIVPADKRSATYQPPTTPAIQRPAAHPPGAADSPPPRQHAPVDRTGPATGAGQPVTAKPNPPPRQQGQRVLPEERQTQPRPQPGSEQQARPQRPPGPPQQQEVRPRPQPAPQQHQKPPPEKPQTPSPGQNGKPDEGN